MRISTCMKFMAIPVILVSIVTMSNSQPQRVRTLAINAVRPLATAADELQRKYGLLINYEEPAHTNVNYYQLLDE